MSSDSESCSFSATDSSFGPSVNPCRRPFDFTLLFEDIFFQLLPSCLFILAGGVRLFATLLRRSPRARWGGPLHAVKLISLSVFSSLQLALLVCICTRPPSERSNLSVPASALCFVSSLQLLLVSHFEHTRSYRPSSLISLYLSITLLLRIANLRTYAFLYGISSSIFAISLTSVLVQSIVIVLEHCSKAKRFLAQNREQKISREEAAGPWSRITFAWLNRLLVTGYTRPLKSDDLRIVDLSLESSRMAEDFARLQSSGHYGPIHLLVATYKCLGLLGLLPAIPRLCMTGFTFAQPFLASSLISYLEDPNPPKNNGYGLIGATILVYGGMAISQSIYNQVSWKGSTKIRGGLVEAINAKMLRLKYEKGVESKVLTLIINDAWRIVMGTVFLHNLWAAVLETSIGTWLLWRQVGPASLAVVGVAVLALILAVVIGSRIGDQQSGWLAATETRLEATKSLLSSLKAVKMMGSGERMKTAIEDLRVLEFAASRLYRILIVGTVICSFLPLTMAPVAVFGAYVGSIGYGESENGTFDTAKMFSSLILIGLIANPLIHVFQIVPNLGAAVGCAQRVGEFLRKEEIADSRSHIECGRGEPRRGDGPPPLNENQRPGIFEYQNPSSSILAIRNADISWDSDSDSDHPENGNRKEKEKKKGPLLKNISMDASRGQHIAITGPVGCGKSLLLQAILGEVTPKAGRIELCHDLTVGYCTQLAWLENLTVRDNIFRGLPNHQDRLADESWRERVIDACGLRELVDAEIAGTTIGSGGSRISGGEKQRLALARAIASRPSLLLLDDIFSAIDRSTKKTIFDRLFGPQGIVTELARNITVIQVTQDRHVAELADTIYKIDENGHLAPYQFSSDNGDKGENGEITAATSETGSSNIPGGLAHADDKDREEEEGEEKKRPPHTGVNESEEKEEHADPASIGDREVYKVYFGTIGRLNMCIFVLGLMTFAFTLRFPDIWVRWWTFDGNLEQPTKTTGYWIGLYSLLGALPLFVALLSFGHLAMKIIPRSGVGLHTKLIGTVVHSTYVFVTRLDTGSIMNRFNQDLMLVDFKLPADLFNTCSTFCIVIVQLVLVSIGAVYSLAVLPVILLVLFAVQHFYLRTSKRLRQLDLETKAELHTKVSETYTGIVTIRAHGWTRKMLHEFWEKLDRTQEPQYLLWMVQTWLAFVLDMVVTGLAVVVAGIAIALPGRTSAGALGVAFVNMASLGEFLTHVIQSWTSLETSLGAIARIEAFERDTPVESSPEDPIEVLPPQWPEKGAIEFEHVSASYHHHLASSESEEAEKDVDKVVWGLEDITLKINPGERIAICGRSGSGKSTLLLTLLGLVPTSPRGTIRLDGVDISRVPKEMLRSKFCVISQESFPLLMQGEKIRDVLDPEGLDKDGDDDRAIETVLSECCILEKVKECGGLDGSFREKSLSVGETQLFGLARAVLHTGGKRGRGGGVVLFDEATSSIDTATERKIMNLMAEKLKGRTIISVLHRLEAALENYDRILVLERGRVVHFGTPDKVVQEAELFASLR